jgi:hypothetical protein
MGTDSESFSIDLRKATWLRPGASSVAGRSRPIEAHGSIKGGFGTGLEAAARLGTGSIAILANACFAFSGQTTKSRQ